MALKANPGMLPQLAESQSGIARGIYALGMAIVSVLAIALGLIVTRAVGGPDIGQSVLVAVGAALLLSAAFALIPMVGPPLVPSDRWGMAVMMASMGRTLAAMGAMVMLLEVQGLPRKPVVYGVLSGVFVMMMAEAMIAVWLLNKRDRELAILRQSASGKLPSSIADASPKGAPELRSES